MRVVPVQASFYAGVNLHARTSGRRERPGHVEQPRWKIGVGGQPGLLQGHLHVRDVERMAWVGQGQVEREMVHQANSFQSRSNVMPYARTRRASVVIRMFSLLFSAAPRVQL